MGVGGIKDRVMQGLRPPLPSLLEEADAGAGDVVHSEAMFRSAKILERMVNQNTFEEITHDFKFWEDQSDSYREGEG